MPSATTRPSKQSTTGKARKRTSAGKSNAHSESKHKPSFNANTITEIPSIEAAVKKCTEVQGICPECLMIPEMQLQEFRELCRSIAATGLQHDILLTHDGKLIDGRCRLRACLVTGQPPRFRTVEADQQPLAIALANFTGRKLTTGQKAAFAHSLLPSLKAFAKARQRTNSRNANADPELQEFESSELVANFHTLEDFRLTPGLARDQAAKLAGCSGKSVDSYGRLLKARPDCAEEVAAGKQSLHSMVRQLRPLESPVNAMPANVKETEKETTRTPAQPQPVKSTNSVGLPMELPPAADNEPAERSKAREESPHADVESMSSRPTDRNGFLDELVDRYTAYQKSSLVTLELDWLAKPIVVFIDEQQSAALPAKCPIADAKFYKGNSREVLRKVMADFIVDDNLDLVDSRKVSMRKKLRKQLLSYATAKQVPAKKSSKRKPR